MKGIITNRIKKVGGHSAQNGALRNRLLLGGNLPGPVLGLSRHC